MTMEPPTSATSASSAIPIDAHVENTKNFSKELRAPLYGLTAAFDALNVQTMQVALLGKTGTKEEIADLRQRMRDQEQRHKDGLQEIQSILDDLLNNQTMEAMREQVEDEIKTQIDALVRAQVAACLAEHIPEDLQTEFAMSKRELEELNLRLHNSESRRANGKLRSNRPGENLATMLMTDGRVSAAYPTNLRGLFSLDAEKVDALMRDYELPDPARSRDRNLNRLMQFCGVRYQLVE